MRKGAISNLLQRSFIFCCVMLVTMMVFVTRGDKVEAYDWQEDSCVLQSITLESGGKQYTFDGNLEPVVVPNDTDWKEFLSGMKIVDYKVIESATCTHGNHKLSGYLTMGDNDEGLYVDDFITYQEGETTIQLDVENLDNVAYATIDFRGDANWDDYNMEITFTEQYNIEYDLDGGSLPEGVMTTISPSKRVKLPFPVRDGYIFQGWTLPDEETPVVNRYIGYGIASDIVCTAHWEEVVGEPVDLTGEDFEISYNDVMSYTGGERCPSVWIYDYSDEDYEDELTEGQDYVVTYKNNIEMAQSDDTEAPPIIIITGVGNYTGTIEKTFSIKKDSVKVSSGNLTVEKGATLSTVDFSGMIVRANNTDVLVPGTWEWKNPETVVNEEVGERPWYEAVFTPTDTACYNTLEKELWVVVKASMKECEAIFVDGPTYSYTGENIAPEIKIMDGENTLQEGTDYIVSYENNVNACDKSATDAPTVIVTGEGDYKGTKKVTFTIDKATPTIDTAPTASAIEEGKKLSDSTLSGGKVTDVKGATLEGEFSWKDGIVVPTLADSDVTKYTVVFTPKDTANYKTIEIEVVIKVNATSGGEGPVDGGTDTKPEDGSADGGANAQPEVGDKTTDKANKATYKVTKSAEGKMEVTYVAPTKKSKMVSVPATVKLADGTTAKVTAIAAKAFKGDAKLQTITIGKNVKTIGKEAFSGCKNLKKVKSAKNVEKIGKEAFANCKKLTSVAMSSDLKSIGDKAFYKCTKLAKITIPKNVKSIGASAFQGCSKLKSITIKTTKLTKKNVKKNAFKGIPSKAKIDVPNGKVKAYKSILQSRGVSKKATIK